MRLLFVALLFAASVVPACAGQWRVTKNEPDPFDKTRATFVALTQEGGATLAIRCLENGVSLALAVGAGFAREGDEFEMRVVADAKEPISTTGETLNANAFSSSIQFGDEDTVAYLAGAKKYFVRAQGADTTQTFAFTGGPSLDNVIAKAQSACGIKPEAASPPPAPDVKYAAQCSAEKSCKRMYGCLVSRNELGGSNDSDGFAAWCARQPGMKP